MKNLVKLVNIHDGNSMEHYNNNRLYIESNPRAEKIIAAFFDDGWKLLHCTQRTNPAISQSGNYTFYLGGWEFLFSKTVDDDTEDNSDELISNALKKLGHATNQEGDFYNSDALDNDYNEDYDDSYFDE